MMIPHSRRSHRNSEAGFTLTELLVVLVVLGLIAAAITPQIMGRLDKSKVRAAKLQLDTLSSSIEMFKLDTGRYPTTEEGLSVLVSAPSDAAHWDGPYVRSGDSIVDPWRTTIDYTFVSGARSYQLRSYGADGIEGGEKYDTDIVFPDFSNGRQTNS